MVRDTLWGFPAHTLYPQGVCGIRKAAQPLTAALPFRCGEFTTLLAVSKLSLCRPDTRRTDGSGGTPRVIVLLIRWHRAFHQDRLLL